MFIESWGLSHKNVMSKKQKKPESVRLGSDEYVSRLLRYPLINQEISGLLGKVLTVIDASIADPVQNKAVKDIVREHFFNLMQGTLWDYCYRKAFVIPVGLEDEIIYSTVKNPGTTANVG